MARKWHLIDNNGKIQCSRVRKFQSAGMAASLDRFVKKTEKGQCKDCKAVADRWIKKRTPNQD